ncbi:MAG TPA: PEP-CTERM sorting domain-containing protein [Candidatus Dormibacteraeota bacterium]|jgi:hypothetical protein|nr:PEP-CTERM sorting domain-containing protein [Candidatus Dormibacteraeota bacterium]
MRYLIFALGLILLVCAVNSPALADSVQYTVNGTFSPDVNAAPLSGANGNYSISFSIAQNPVPDFFDASAGDFAIANLPISYSFQCAGCSSAVSFNGLAEDIDFAGPGLGGMFALEFLVGGHDYFLQFSGDTLFTGSVDQPTLTAGGPFDLTNAGMFELDSNDFVSLGSATVNAVATPEPSTLTLMLGALASLGLIALVKTKRA